VIATYEAAAMTTEQGNFLRYKNAKRVTSYLFDHTNESVSGAATTAYNNNFSTTAVPFSGTGTFSVSLNSGRLKGSGASSGDRVPIDTGNECVSSLRRNFYNKSYMRVKCIKVSLDDDTDDRILNRDMRQYLRLDSIFCVYGIRFSQNIVYVYLYNGAHLFEVPIKMFSIIDDGISTTWKGKMWGDGDVSLWPELFYRNNFLENFAEHEQQERDLFKQLSAEIESGM
jgi:hypothetical protein